MIRRLVFIGTMVSFGLSGFAVLPRAVDAVSVFGIRHDPVAMLLYRLSDMDLPAYEREIAAALAKDDAELARSLAELAAGSGIAISAPTLERIAEAEKFSVMRSASQVWSGAVNGQADSPTAFAAALAADLTVIGDVRDLTHQALAYPEQDNVTVALAATGLALTGAAAFSGGTSLAGKAGVSAIKAAKKMKRLSKGLEQELVRLTRNAIDSAALRDIARDAAAWDFAAAMRAARRVVRPQVIDEIGDTGNAVRGVFTRQGYRGTLQVLETAESTADVRQLRRTSDRLGDRFRGALHLKRGARTALTAIELLFGILFWIASAVMWIVWAAYVSVRVTWKTGSLMLGMMRPVLSRPVP